MQDCLFCKIVAGEIPADIVYRDEEVVVFRDINPQAPQHLLFIPRRHIASMTDLVSGDGPILASIHMTAIKVAKDLGLEESGGYRFVINVGPNAGQSVFHLHFHLLGGRQLSWPPG